MTVTEFGIDPELAAIIAELEAAVAGPAKNAGVLFLKEGEHFLKMVLPQGRTLRNYFQTYDNTYNGDVFKYFIINAVMPQSTQTSDANREKIRHIKATKTMIQGITAQLASWPNLFESGGPVIKVKIYKEGGQTKYLVSITSNRFDTDACEWPESTIDEAALDQEQFTAKQSNEQKDPLAFAAPKPANDKQVPW